MEPTSTSVVSKAVAGAVIGIGAALNANAIPLISLLGTPVVEISGIALALGSVTYAVEKTVKKTSLGPQSIADKDMIGTLNKLNAKRAENMYLNLRNDVSSMVHNELGGVRKDAEAYLENRISSGLETILSGFTDKLSHAGIAPAVNAQPAQEMEDNSQLHAVPHTSLVALVSEYLDAKEPGTLSPAYLAVIDAAGLAGNAEVRKHAELHLARAHARPTRKAVIAPPNVSQQPKAETPVKKVPQQPQTMVDSPSDIVMDLQPQLTAATQV
ncbi:MAG: hypothetical protein JRN68_01015 [Nitrososphaerota archaeon]|nr:hypothetical protein [Ferrimicrobium acidiphilum]MDG6933256.1 hypothetical protein [Nitrososphaerota archaeon]